MNFATIKTNYDAIYRSACINGDTTPVQKRNLETLRSDLSDLQDQALGNGDTSGWTEAFNLTEEIDQLLGVDYNAEMLCHA